LLLVFFGESPMSNRESKELRRRSLVKSLLWRLIGVIWTWVGAYIILLLVPPTYKSAAFIATLIVVYHHSTRMIMYYVYERIWASVEWGCASTVNPMSKQERFLWVTSTIVALAFIFFLLLEVQPRIKREQPAGKGKPAIAEPHGLSGQDRQPG
jgi:uncharacterized membrane protein